MERGVGDAEQSNKLIAEAQRRWSTVTRAYTRGFCDAGPRFRLRWGTQFQDPVLNTIRRATQLLMQASSPTSSSSSHSPSTSTSTSTPASALAPAPDRYALVIALDLARRISETLVADASCDLAMAYAIFEKLGIVTDSDAIVCAGRLADFYLGALKDTEAQYAMIVRAVSEATVSAEEEKSIRQAFARFSTAENQAAMDAMTLPEFARSLAMPRVARPTHGVYLFPDAQIDVISRMARKYVMLDIHKLSLNYRQHGPRRHAVGSIQDSTTTATATATTATTTTATNTTNANATTTDAVASAVRGRANRIAERKLERTHEHKLDATSADSTAGTTRATRTAAIARTTTSARAADARPDARPDQGRVSNVMPSTAAVHAARSLGQKRHDVHSLERSHVRFRPTTTPILIPSPTRSVARDLASRNGRLARLGGLVELRESPVHGIGMFARHAIAASHVICAEEATLFVTHRSARCVTCAGVGQAGVVVACAMCQIPMFCSVQCHDAALETWHAVICPENARTATERGYEVLRERVNADRTIAIHAMAVQAIGYTLAHRDFPIRHSHTLRLPEFRPTQAPESKLDVQVDLMSAQDELRWTTTAAGRLNDPMFGMDWSVPTYTHLTRNTFTSEGGLAYYGTALRYVNHSCADANAMVSEPEYGREGRRPIGRLVATRDIAAGEEIFIDVLRMAIVMPPKPEPKPEPKSSTLGANAANRGHAFAPSPLSKPLCGPPECEPDCEHQHDPHCDSKHKLAAAAALESTASVAEPAPKRPRVGGGDGMGPLTLNKSDPTSSADAERTRREIAQRDARTRALHVLDIDCQCRVCV